MKSISIAGTQAPAIIQGCMRIDAMSVNELEELIHQDLKLGINFFDLSLIHIYTMCRGNHINVKIHILNLL